jgi:ribosomal-protein-alanine acetyltransferase
VRVRPAEAADAAPVAALDRAVFGVDGWSDPTVLAELTGPGRFAVVADDGGEVRGYAITWLTEEVVDLQRIAVHPDHRRVGLAQELFAAVLDRAAADGAYRMLLEVSARNAGALAFYAAAGFHAFDRRRRYYRDGADALVMVRPLRPLPPS